MTKKGLTSDQILAILQDLPEDVSEFEGDSENESDEDFVVARESDSPSSDSDNNEDCLVASAQGQSHQRLPTPTACGTGRRQKRGARQANLVLPSHTVPKRRQVGSSSTASASSPMTAAHTHHISPGSDKDKDSKTLVAANGMIWTLVTSREKVTGRLAQHNVLREIPGPTVSAKKDIIIGSPASAWRLFIDKFILNHIKKCTITEANRKTNSDNFTLSDEELDAFIGIMYARGVAGTNDLPVHSLWTDNWGVSLCKKAMSRNRFCEILRFLRFDERSSRSERLQTDKFFLFSTVWNRFIANCIACYKPGAYITVDEQLFPSKARCPFTQYIASKPDKFGQKYWLAVDKDSKYLINGFPYTGKDNTRPTEERVSDHVVMQLMTPFLKKGRNVTTDNYFTSVTLAKNLKKNGTSLLGTMNKVRREVPAQIKSMKEPIHSTKVYKNDDMTLTVYQGKPRKNVVILSTLISDVNICDNAKKTPETIKLYNETKYGVDIIDQMARKYTVRTSSRRWPVHSFQNTLDLAGINAWIIYKEVTSERISRRVFIQRLAEELAELNIRSRKVLLPPKSNQESGQVPAQMAKYCQVKVQCKKNRAVGICITCKNSVCGTCTSKIERFCKNC